jgi:light-regulated signal transduction histidine kinase (bacteriophytochrome)
MTSYFPPSSNAAQLSWFSTDEVRGTMQTLQHSPEADQVSQLRQNIRELQLRRSAREIIDQGIGIDPMFHEKIFQVFECLHGYANYQGTDIGLAIARRAVERMNGRIWVKSELGKGSCFCSGLRRV